DRSRPARGWRGPRLAWSQPALGDVSGEHAGDEQHGQRSVDRPDERRAPRRAAQPEVVQRAPDLAAVEEADGDEVEQVEEETGVAERLQELRVRRLARAPDGGSPGRPDQRARERDPG